VIFVFISEARTLPSLTIQSSLALDTRTYITGHVPQVFSRLLALDSELHHCPPNYIILILLELNLQPADCLTWDFSVSILYILSPIINLLSYLSIIYLSTHLSIIISLYVYIYLPIHLSNFILCLRRICTNTRVKNKGEKTKTDIQVIKLLDDAILSRQKFTLGTDKLLTHLRMSI
jgi:hypothetical protein